MEVRSDCPDCRSAGSVERGVCQVCFAETPDALAGGRASEVILALPGTPPVPEASGTDAAPALGAVGA